MPYDGSLPELPVRPLMTKEHKRLQALADALIAPMPEGFVYAYGEPEHCAVGLAEHLGIIKRRWRDRFWPWAAIERGDFESWTRRNAKLFGLSRETAAAIFVCGAFGADAVRMGDGIQRVLDKLYA